MKTITIEQLKELLFIRKVHFQYEKFDGTICEAFGTMQFTFIPENMQPKDTSTYFEFKNLRYFDFKKNGWRSIGKNVKEVTLLD